MFHDLKCLWIVLHDDDIWYDMVLMMPRRGMTMLINIYNFYIMTHMRVFTLVMQVLPMLYNDSYEISMDEPMERLLMGLIYMWCAPAMGGVVEVSTTTIWGELGMSRCRHVAYPSQHQCRALYMIFYGFTILKPIHIVFFKGYMYY